MKTQTQQAKNSDVIAAKVFGALFAIAIPAFAIYLIFVR